MQNERIKEHDSLEEYKDNMVKYAIVVIRRRALSEIRDGLKPIQRRILWTFYKDIKSNGFVKSQKVTGAVIGSYSPHGDTSAYMAFRPMINDFQAKIPLLEQHGNFGTISGEPASAARYTEARLSKFAWDVIFNNMIDDERVIDYSPNFDGTTKEPDYLPTSVPLLLINGSSGIAVGIASDIPVHNPVEVIEVTRKLLRNPKADFVLIPDQCTPTKIIDTDWRTINQTGHGSCRVRGLVEIGTYKAGRDREEYPAIFIKSLPDGVYSGSIKEAIEKMAEKKECPMIKDVYDNTKMTVDLVVQLNKGADPEFVKQLLYKKTDLEKSIKINFEAIDDIDCHSYSYREYLLKFIEYRKITKFRQYNFRLRNIATRMHTLETYLKAMKSGYIDEIVGMIRRQKKVDDNSIMTEYIIKHCKMTQLQAEFILRTDLRRLAEGYIPIYEKEFKQLSEDFKVCESFILNPEKIINEIDQEMLEIEKKYGMPRMAKIIKASDDTNIPKGTFKLVITENNYIRKLSLDDKANAIKGDQSKFILKVENTESILLFDNKGKVFKLPVHKVNPTDKNSPGIDIKLLIRNCTADIAAVIYEPALKQVLEIKNNKHFIATVTAGNYIKKMDIEDFINVPTSGMIYTKLPQNDYVKDVIIAPNKFDVIVYSGHKALRIGMNEIPVYKRASQGVFAMNTRDTISGLSLVYPDATHIVVVTESGKFNKYIIAGLEKSTRNRAGNSVIKLGKNDRIVAIYGVNDKNTLSVVTETGRGFVPVANVPIGSSASAGVKMLEEKSPVVIKAEVIS